ncbi:MAG: hypothetical protein ACI4F4_04050 [Lachnospiraceae bacterium]
MEKYNKARKIVALLTVLIIVFCIITMVVMAITGSKYFLGFLFLSIVLPVILWIPFWFVNLTAVKDDLLQSSKSEKNPENEK